MGVKNLKELGLEQIHIRALLLSAIVYRIVSAEAQIGRLQVTPCDKRDARKTETVEEKWLLSTCTVLMLALYN